MIKVSYFIHRLPSLSAVDFHRYWRENHGPLIKKHARLFGIRRYVQLHATEDERNAPSQHFPERYDGVAELWFESHEKLELWLQNTTPETQAAGREIREDERKFIDRARSPALIGEEVKIIDGD